MRNIKKYKHITKTKKRDMITFKADDYINWLLDFMLLFFVLLLLLLLLVILLFSIITKLQISIDDLKPALGLFVVEFNLTLLTIVPRVTGTTCSFWILQTSSVKVTVIPLQEQTGAFQRNHMISGVYHHSYRKRKIDRKINLIC